jgi:transposase
MVLSPPERQRLRQRVRSRSARAEEVQRAKIILLMASGQSQWAVSRRLGCSINTVRLWLKRFREERLAGLFSRHRGKIAGQQSAKLEAQILAAARQRPKDGSTHWSTRKLAAELGTNHTRVARVLSKAGLQPHRLRRYMASDDPDFEIKAADIIGLYLKPPVNAAVFCVDEKSAIQALDRLDPVLPLSPGRAERHGFEYYRHGTLSLYAALNSKTGQVLATPPLGTPVRSLLLSLNRSWPAFPKGRRFTLLQIISRPIAPPGSGSLSIVIATSGSILRPPILLGLTKSRSGFPRSNATSSPAGSFVRSKTWRKNS